MGHVYVDVRLRGSEEEAEVRGVLVDSGSSYTVMPRDVLEGVGAWKLPYEVDLELGDGRIVKAGAYALIIAIGDREAPTICLSFEGAKPVVGVLSLEGLGLKIDPVKGVLQPTRPKGLAYFYLKGF
jgi:predicted aspartyl protease